MADVGLIYAAEPTAVGSIFVAPKGTPAPAEPDDPGGAVVTLDLDLWTDMGDVGEDGFTEKTDRKIDRKRNFGGKVIKVLQSEWGKSYDLVFLETLNADVLKAIHGANNVDITPATDTHGTQIVVRKNSSRLPHLSYVIDTIDSSLGDDEDHPARFREYIPDGQIVDTGDVKIVHTDTIEYKCTIEAFEVNGNNVISWSDDGRLATGSVAS
jgi:hypothetical protein